MASVKRRGKSWRARVFVHKEEGGRQKSIDRTFRTRAEADQWVRDTESEVRRGSYVVPSTITLREFVRHWLSGTAKTRLRPRTLEQYRGLLERHVLPVLGAIPLSRIKLAAIDELYASLTAKGLGARSVRYVHATLRTLLTSAVRQGLIVSNPCAHATLPRIGHSEASYLTPEQVNAFLDAAKDDPWYPYWLVLATTGMRPSEALGLKWNDISAGKISIARTSVRQGSEWRFEDCKTAKSKRTVTIPEITSAALRAHRKVSLKIGDGLVFPGENDGPPDMRSLVRLHFDPYRKVAKLPKVSPYVLRHSHISALLAAGVPVRTVADRVGHANATMTLNVYAHVGEDDRAGVIEILERLARVGH